MKCSYTTDNLISFQLNELQENEMHKMKQHLEACSICQEQMTELLELKNAWDYPLQITITDDFTNLIMYELENEITEKRRLMARLNFNTLTHFSIASVATFALLYFGGFGNYLNFLDGLTSGFINASNNLNLAIIKGTLWLDGFTFQLTNLLNIF